MDEKKLAASTTTLKSGNDSTSSDANGSDNMEDGDEKNWPRNLQPRR